MALDIASITALPPQLEGMRLPGSGSAPREAPPAAVAPDPARLEAIMADLQRVSATFNRRLSFSVNEKLDQVVVKVIDTDTDKVIKEIPPKELQHVYERIREVIGLLLDEQA